MGKIKENIYNVNQEVNQQLQFFVYFQRVSSECYNFSSFKYC